MRFFGVVLRLAAGEDDGLVLRLGTGALALALLVLRLGAGAGASSSLSSLSSTKARRLVSSLPLLLLRRLVRAHGGVVLRFE